MFLIKAKILDKTYNLLTMKDINKFKNIIYLNIHNSHPELDSGSIHSHTTNSSIYLTIFSI